MRILGARISGVDVADRRGDLRWAERLVETNMRVKHRERRVGLASVADIDVGNEGRLRRGRLDEVVYAYAEPPRQLVYARDIQLLVGNHRPVTLEEVRRVPRDAARIEIDGVL